MSHKATPSESRLHRTSKVLAALVLAVALVVAPNAFTPPAQAVEDESGVAITEGSVVWGFKESWRNYMGKDGTELADGVAWTDDDLFEFPVESGSFDEASNTLRLDLAGSLHFTGYCDEGGFCQLDSKFEDLSIEIGAEQQLVRGTYIGRPQSDPGADFERQENAVFAVLDIWDVDPSTADGITSWESIPAASGGILYGEGTPLDPVSIRYTGPGGKPDLAERWDAAGTPVFEPGAQWTSTPGTAPSSSSVPAVHASESEDLLFVTEFLGTNGQGEARYVFRALDPVSLEEQNSTEFSAGDTQYVRTAFDPTGNTVFFMVGETIDERRTVSLHAAQWTGDSFSIESLASVAGAAGVTSWPLAGGVLAWTGSELVWSTLLRDSGIDNYTDHILHGFTRSEAGWAHAEHGLDLPQETKQGTSARARAFFGNGVPADRNEQGYVVQSDGSIILALGGTYQELDGTVASRPLVRLSRAEGETDWRARYLPGTVGVKPDITTQPFSGVTRAADGALLAFGSAGAERIQYVELDGDTVVSAVTVAPSTNRAGSGVSVAVDHELGLEYSLSPATGTAQVLSGRAFLADIGMPNGLVQNPVFAVVKDHGIISSVTYGSDGRIVIRRYDSTGITPTVTTQPQATAVSLTQGALTAPAAFSVGHETGEDTTVQWQRKLPGQSRFQYVDGATGAEYAPEVGLELNGAEYRAVVSNAAGKVVSDAAALSVVSAPRFASQPVDLAVYDGDTAHFTAPISEEVAGEQRWERLVEGQWIAIESDDVFTVDGGILSVVASEAVHGATFRSVLFNEVGENMSNEVALAVQPRVVIPEDGLKYSGIGFAWDFSNEMQAAPPFGGANHFSAGVSDGTENTYLAESGNVKVVHEASDGTRSDVAYANRSAFIAGGGRQLVTLSNGAAKVMPDGSATVTWEGSFSVNMYGGLVPFTITNPRLAVASDGTGTLAGDLSGYAGEMSSPNSKTPLEPVTGAAIATFSGVTVDVLNGFTVAPHYAGVEVQLPEGATPQVTTGQGWGAWPQQFVDFQMATGLSSYWYSSGSTFDPKKAPNPFLVDFRDAEEVSEPEPLAPAITRQPSSVRVAVGNDAVFTATASGTPAPTVQWQSKGASGSWTNIAGATSTSYTVAKAKAAASGTQYRAVFTNTAGKATTNAATLTVTEARPPFTDVRPGDKFSKEIVWMHDNGLSTGVKQADGSVKYLPKDGVSREAMAAFMYRLAGKPKFTAPKTSPFADLQPGDKFYTEITWLASEKITTGVQQASGKPKFLPKSKISREAMAAFVYRSEGKPKFSAPKASPFADMKPADKFYREIAWMRAEGLSTGVKQASGKPKYLPKSNVSREAMAAFIYRLES